LRKTDFAKNKLQKADHSVMDIKERAERAVQLKTMGGYNCSQAVTAVFADQTDLTEEQLKQITAGFCAGMGNLEATCGALIGAGMIAGLKTEGKGTLKLTRQMQETFNERCGAIKCKDLKTITNGKPLCPCEECVRNAVLIYGEVLGTD
jgi:C_GCAxxG_C_C family probable redox protein